MREYYDGQVYRQVREQDAARERQAAAYLAENTRTNPLKLAIGRMMVEAGQRLQADAKRPQRRAYR